MTGVYRLKNLQKLMYLDTKKADYNNGFDYHFRIPDFQLKDIAKLRVDTVSAYGVTTGEHITIKASGIEYKNNHYFNSDRSGLPTLYMGTLSNNINEKSFEAELILPPQTINTITLNIKKTTDETALENDQFFIIGLVFNEVDSQSYVEIIKQMY
jgi:hypothetical protein